MPESPHRERSSDVVHDERRFQRGIAWISAIAALLGALIGGGTSYLATKQQMESQADQAQTDFLRSERRTAYSKVIELNAALEKQEHLTLVLVGDDRPKYRKRIAPSLQRQQSLVESLELATVSVEVVGSPQVVGPCPRSLDTGCVGLRGFRDGSHELVLVGVRGHLPE